MEISFNGWPASKDCAAIGIKSYTVPGTTVKLACAEVYIANYASTTSYKGISIDSVSENNGTTAYMRLSTDVWSQNTAINQLTFYASSGNIAQYSTATLYGISKT